LLANGVPHWVQNASPEDDRGEALDLDLFPLSLPAVLMMRRTAIAIRINPRRPNENISLRSIGRRTVCLYIEKDRLLE